MNPLGNYYRRKYRLRQRVWNLMFINALKWLFADRPRRLLTREQALAEFDRMTEHM